MPNDKKRKKEIVDSHIADAADAPSKKKLKKEKAQLPKLMKRYLAGRPLLVVRILSEVLREDKVARVLRYRREGRLKGRQDDPLVRVHYWNHVSPFKVLFKKDTLLDIMAKKIFLSVNILETHAAVPSRDKIYDLDLCLQIFRPGYRCVKHVAFASFDPITHVHGGVPTHGSSLRDVELIKHCAALKQITLLDFASNLDAALMPPPDDDWAFEKFEYRKVLRPIFEHSSLEKVELRISATIRLTEALRHTGLTAEMVVENRLRIARLFKDCLREGFQRTSKRDVRVNILQVRKAFSGIFE